MLVIIDSENMLEAFLGDNPVDNFGCVKREGLVRILEIFNFTSKGVKVVRGRADFNAGF